MCARVWNLRYSAITIIINALTKPKKVATTRGFFPCPWPTSASAAEVLPALAWAGRSGTPDVCHSVLRL